MPRSHIELAVGSEAAAFDAMTGALSIEGFDGFWEDGNTLRAYIGSERWDDGRLDTLREMLTRITNNLSIPPPSLALARIADQNWNKTWEQTIRPVRVTARIVVAPTWEPFNAGPDDIVLTIDPKMSFGTGYHESTRLMLGMIEHYTRAAMRVLDAGTGTGILAIAALKLGAASAVGFDIDEWSFVNAIENAHLNGVSDRFAVRLGDLSVVTETGFDMIGANIQKNVIEEMLPGLVRRLGRGGILLLSGLLSADRDGILSSIRDAGLSPSDERREGEWIALALERS